MRKIERVPRLSSECDFPTADVTDQKKLARASAWIAYADTLQKDDFRHFMDIRYVPRSTDTLQSRLTYNAAVYLCREWDTRRGDGRHFTSTGFIISRALMNDTALYPNCNVNMETPLGLMKKESNPEHFARASWQGMQDSHPNVHEQYRALYEMAAKRYDLTNIVFADSFMAGMAVPYMLSAMGQLELLAKQSKFTGLAGEKRNLSETEFSRFFTSKVPLASSNPELRLSSES
jgi:hypothetical protein